MYAPAKHDEITGLVNYIDQQLEAIRSSVHGLTEEQAHRTPCRSALSIGALIKHAVWVMRSVTSRLTEGPRLDPLTEEGFADFADSTTFGERESAAELLPRFDAARKDYLDAIRASDPDAEGTEPSAPWHGIDEPRPIRLRFHLVHQVEELARHAGHADIIREQIDGHHVSEMVLTRAGAPANDFFTPYEPAEGTITG